MKKRWKLRVTEYRAKYLTVLRVELCASVGDRPSIKILLLCEE